MNKTILAVGIVVLIIVIGGAYWVFANKTTFPPTVTNQTPIVTSGENPQPGGIHDMPVEPAAAAARKDLATKLAVNEKSIVIMQVEEKTWTDGCLGLARLDELCTEALVDGYRVEMVAAGKTYVYRTNKTGTSVRAEAQ